MKKFFKLFAITICALFAGVALTACGGKDAAKLKESDVVGMYHVSNVVFTPEDATAFGYDRVECSYDKIRDLRGQGEIEDPLDQLTYTMFDENVFLQYEAVALETGGGEILNNNQVKLATWKIKNNKFVFEPIAGRGLDGATAKYEEGKVVVSAPYADPDGTLILTLERWTMADLMKTLAGEDAEKAVYKIQEITYTPDEDANRGNDGDGHPVRFVEGEYYMRAEDWEALQNDHSDYSEDEWDELVDIFDGGMFFTYDIMPDGRGLQHEDTNVQYGRFWFENGYLKYERNNPAYAACTYEVSWDEANEAMYITVVEPSSVSGVSGIWQYYLERVYIS